MTTENAGKTFKKSDKQGIYLVNSDENQLIADYIVNNISNPRRDELLKEKKDAIKSRRILAMISGITGALSFQTIISLEIPIILKLVGITGTITGSAIILLENRSIDDEMKSLNER